jgi:hypothetical protein
MLRHDYWSIRDRHDHGDRLPELPSWERWTYYVFGACIIAAIALTVLGF